MKQKSMSSHRKPKMVDKGSTSDNWRQVFADIGQSLGFSGGGKKKPAPKTLPQLPSEPKEEKEVKVVKQRANVSKKETNIVQNELPESQVPEQEPQKSQLPLPKIQLSKRKKITLGLILVIAVAVWNFRGSL